MWREVPLNRPVCQACAGNTQNRVSLILGRRQRLRRASKRDRRDVRCLADVAGGQKNLLVQAGPFQVLTCETCKGLRKYSNVSVPFPCGLVSKSRPLAINCRIASKKAPGPNRQQKTAPKYAE